MIRAIRARIVFSESTRTSDIVARTVVCDVQALGNRCFLIYPYHLLLFYFTIVPLIRPPFFHLIERGHLF